MPRYHPDFAFFRGLVEFDADDSGLLPWTTTKTGVDVDNPIYSRVRNEMKSVMRPLLQVLKNRSAESKDFNDNKIDSTPINDSFAKAEADCSLVGIHTAKYGEEPVFPERELPGNMEPMTTIQYVVKLEHANLVKNSLGVSSNKDLGLETFRYYFDMEVSDE